MRSLLLAAAAFAAACGNGGTDAAAPEATNPAARKAGGAADPQVETFASGLVRPWALAVLPDGRMLVSERPGRLRYVGPQGELSEPIAGVPDVFAQGQGGLLDVALDPDFQANRLVYLSYAEPGPGGTAGTAVARGRLEGDRLADVEVIFRQRPKVAGPNHFGSRLEFGPEGNLFVTLGERFQFDPAQNLANTLGTIVRIEPDGSIPPGNPFVGRDDAEPAIWSYGHRNIEAAAIHPGNGQLWVAEMGPEGGDELNLPEAGRNYGWPLVSWGQHYDGEDIPDPPTRPELARSIRHWTPVISPSGMIFYTGDLFPGWRGDALIGGLTAQGVVRLEIENAQVADEHRIEIGQRIREVAQGPDGAVYLLTDEPDGEILRLTPRGGRGG